MGRVIVVGPVMVGETPCAAVNINRQMVRAHYQPRRTCAAETTRTTSGIPKMASNLASFARVFCILIVKPEVVAQRVSEKEEKERAKSQSPNWGLE